MRLLAISFYVVLALIIGLASAHFWGLSQSFATYKHAFLEESQPYLVSKVYSLENAKEILALKKDVIFWLDLRTTADKAFLILPAQVEVDVFTSEKLKERYKGPKLSFYTLAEVKLYFPDALLLEDFLKFFPNNRFIANIIDNVDQVHSAFADKIKSLSAENKMLVQADTEVILKSLREIQPFWLFGTAYPDLMRLLSYESMYVLTAAPFRGDVYIAPMSVFKRPSFNKNVLAEIHRRKKKVILGPLDNPAQVQAAMGFSPDGLIAENQEIFKFMLQEIYNIPNKN